MDVRVLNDITKEQIALEVIVQTYVEPLYMAKKLKTNIYNKIKDEFDVLSRKKRKDKDKEQKPAKNTEEINDVKDLKSQPSKKPAPQIKERSNPRAKTPVANPEFKNFPNAHAQKPERQQGRSLDSREEVDKEIEKIRETYSLENRKLKDVIRQLDRNIYDLDKSLQNARADADDLRRRLSKLAGDKLRTNNPNIADLSDRYRPTNIGKMFSELYDNEWCDAFEEIGKPLKEERQRVNVLHGIVKSAFESCRRKAAAQEEKIRNVLLDIEDELQPDSNAAYKDDTDGLIGNLHNMLIDVRKRILPVSSVNVAKNYMEQEFPTFIKAFDLAGPGKKLIAFAERCTEMSWYMHMCDPPMGMSVDDQQGIPFDKQVYKEYTRSVKDCKQPLVEYYVWPVLYLNVGGNMVSKGVAQPGDGAVKEKK